jgi:hypothetical protein
MCFHILLSHWGEWPIGFDSERICESQIDHFVMAITAAEAIVRHITPAWATACCGWELIGGETQMRKTTLFAVGAALIATGFGVWAASNTHARVAPSMGQGIEPFKLMVSAKDLPGVEFVDYTFVFHWTHSNGISSAIEAWPTPW